MCNKVVINRGEKEITTVGQFMNHFKLVPDVDRKTIPLEYMDDCLCGYDLEAVFKKHGINHKMIDGDFYIGQLENVK
jgi:hypothetical protein